MSTKTALNEWRTALENAVAQTQLVKLSLTKPNATAGDLKSIDIRPITVKRELKLSFTYHHRTRDIVKNHAPAEASRMLTELMEKTFDAAKLQTTIADYQLTRSKAGYHFSSHAPTVTAAPELSHDRAKHRLIRAGHKPYLHALGITDANGEVIKASQDKFRQINKYVEILDGLIKQLPADLPLQIADMGAGKGYLTFALYDHLIHSVKRNATVTGVEYREDLVAICNRIAAESEFTGLHFVQGTIADYDTKNANIVIALHACDTATDDAIAGAIKTDAQLIVVAPCCHKQIRREMQGLSPEHPLRPLLKHGTYVERTAEMVTDSLRAQLMERKGYRTKLFEFIGGEHTPKNVMIVGIKSPEANTQPEIDAQQKAIQALKSEFGIATHYLEKLLD